MYRIVVQLTARAPATFARNNPEGVPWTFAVKDFLKTIQIYDEKAMILPRRANAKINKICSQDDVPESTDDFEQDYAWNPRSNSPKDITFTIMISTTKAFLPTFKRGSLFDRLKDVQRIPIEKPSAASWQEWKSFIFRNFLIQGYQLQYPIDRIYTIGPILRPRTERELITALYTTTHLGASISSILAALPPSLHSLLGTVAIPSDEGLALAHAIEDGTAVGASDGSVINTFDKLYGGSAATIQQPHSDTDAFSCYSVVILCSTCCAPYISHDIYRTFHMILRHSTKNPVKSMMK